MLWLQYKKQGHIRPNEIIPDTKVWYLYSAEGGNTRTVMCSVLNSSPVSGW